MQEALGLTSNRVYRWRLLLVEFGPKIVCIKGIHNTVADAISCLDFIPTKEHKATWMTFTKCWCFYNFGSKEDQSPTTHEDNMNFVFANRNEEDAIYPLTVKEIAQSQSSDKTLEKLTKLEKYKPQLVEGPLQRWQTCHPKRPPTLCSRMVPPLPATSRTQTSGGDSWFYDVLERHAKYCPFLCQIVSQMSSQ